MQPKKRSIKKVEEMAVDSKKKKKKIEETPSNSDQKSRQQPLRNKEKIMNGENSLSNVPIAPPSVTLFTHSNVSTKVSQLMIIIENFI